MLYQMRALVPAGGVSRIFWPTAAGGWVEIMNARIVTTVLERVEVTEPTTTVRDTVTMCRARLRRHGGRTVARRWWACVGRRF